MCGPRTYVVRVGSSDRYVHVDHLIGARETPGSMGTPGGLDMPGQGQVEDMPFIPSDSGNVNVGREERPIATNVESPEVIPELGSQGGESGNGGETGAGIDVSSDSGLTKFESPKSGDHIDSDCGRSRRYPVRDRKPPDRLSYQ